MAISNGAGHRRVHSTSVIRSSEPSHSNASVQPVAIGQNEMVHEGKRTNRDGQNVGRRRFSQSVSNGDINGSDHERLHRSVDQMHYRSIDRLNHAQATKPIAICGMALRLPGNVTTPQQFWDFLLSKGDARSRVPKSRYNISAYHSASGKPGTIKTEHGYFLDEATDLGALDASFFSMTRAELERTDPHHRQMLEVVRECFESAGETGWKGKAIGCYMGSFGEDWGEMFAKEHQQYGLWRVTGYGDFMLSNRVSYEMDLKGPSMTIRTGCSASLTALHEACQAIERGECSSAIVGGANLILAPGMTTAMTEQGVLSVDGSCKSFSADANGYARGEAINCVFIKPLSLALRDGNPIRAVIRSTATNSDGKTPGISCPSSESHEAMIRRAYAVAGIRNFGETAFVECHGTGTQIGDPIEANAVGSVFGESGVYIGSVKPNFGHSEGASGLTSLIKAVLSLENRVIPPNIKFSKPNPKIAFELNGLKVPIEPVPWPKDRCERVSVNSFGIGGSNAHVVIDSATSFGVRTPSRTHSDTPHLLLHSANTQNSLQTLVKNYEQYIEENPGNLSDLAYTLGTRREHLPHRAYSIVGGDISSTTSPSKKCVAPPEIVMVFTGQGAQWPQMGRELIQSNSVFQKSINSMDKTLQGLPNPPRWRIEDELLKPAKTSQLHRAELSQPLCTAVQIALVDSFASAGIEPSAVVGHSSGEIAAAYAAGGLTAREAIIIASHRGVVTKEQKRSGGMAAIGMGWESTAEYLTPGVVVACENSPSSTTISGDLEKLVDVVANIQKSRPEVMARILKVDQAYHSYHMKEIGESYHRSIKDRVTGRHAKKLFFSSVTGRLLTAGETLDARYWQHNLESPVLFRTAISSLLERQSGRDTLFLEIGPHSTLAGPLRQILAQAAASGPYVPAMIRNKNSVESFLSAVGQLYLHNIPINFKALQPSGSVLTDLPIYPWNHENSYWYESRLSKEWRHRKHAHHDLLGSRVTESTDFEPTWRNLFHLDNAGWMRDHKIKDDIVFPFAGYVAMVGEAAMQLTGAEQGFSLRHVVVSTALVLVEGKPIEIMTSLRRHRLTDALDSQWWEFSISSHNGIAWTNHCAGQVMGQTERISVTKNMLPLVRKVQTPKWYETMRRVGLNYGPQFQGLSDIMADTTQQVATAKAVNTAKDDLTFYPLHPTTIDFFLQLFSVAVSKGITWKFSKMAVPTNVEELSVYRCASDINMTAYATSSSTGAIFGSGECLADDKLVLHMAGVKLSPLEDETSIEMSDPHAGARLEWRPDIDFVDTNLLLEDSIVRDSYAPLLDEFTRLCILETKQRLAGMTTRLPHLKKFRDWLDDQIDHTTLKSDDADTSRMERILSLSATLNSTPAAPAAIPMLSVLTHISAIYSGVTEPLEILLANDILTKLYNMMDECKRTALLQLLAHSKPNLRILEIGAGTGGTTATILSDLMSADGRPMYSTYMFTDISSGFFVAAKERFKDSPNMEFAALDITKDPIEQGFQEESYDLVLATNVLHATPSLRSTLKNVRKLLHPEGRLLMQELCTSSKWCNYIMGVLPGWWLGEEDGRINEPYVSPSRWELELIGAGFEGLEAAVLDAKMPFAWNANMVARPKRLPTRRRGVTVLYEEQIGLPAIIKQCLTQQGYEVCFCTITDLPPEGQDVIALVDLATPFFEDIDSTAFESFKRFLVSLGSDAGIFWLTRPSQLNCQDPRFAQTIGTARAIRSEMTIDFATCEIDNVGENVERIVQVFEKFQMRRDDETLQPEFEYAICNGVVNIGRYHPCSINEELLGTDSAHVVALDMSQRGRLSTLHWSQRSRVSLLGDEVEVETRAVGINFRDVLIAMGIVDGDTNGLGLEAAGIVHRIGPNVRDLKIGDRVILLGTGCFSSFVTTSAQLCIKIPASLDFEDGATMPCVYATVIYSLIDVARLERGQSILIHSACGGVGIAAIQIARMLGAEIYASVGSEDKVQHLMSTFDLPRNHIFNSRNTSFLHDLMRETRGKGVDLVLNSLSGELLHASWQCVAEFGKLVEIGKRDLIGHGRLNMHEFMANRSYCGVDLGEISVKKPEICNRLLKSIVKHYEEGDILPIQPTKIFKARSIEDCFRYMQKGQHIGKIVVSMDENLGTALEAKAPRRTLQLDPQASYLLVGGLGGLGRAVSNMMVEHGARHLIYLSRSAGTSATDQSFLRELESQDCSVQVVKGSVARPDDVERAVKGATRPLKGILQMSMVLRDQALSRMTYDEWNDVVAPKVSGTWNLHNATVQMDLDFFVLFSSISGIMGQAGQTNYAGANTFLDAFVQYRRGLNMPASAVDIGVVEDVGYVAQSAGLLNKLKSAGAYGVREPELLDAVTLAMMGPAKSETHPSSSSGFVSQSAFVLGLRSSMPLSDPGNRSPWKKDRRMAAYHNSTQTVAASAADASNDSLKSFLASAAAEPSILKSTESATLLATEIGKKLFDFLLKPGEELDISRSLQDVGMDSLVAIEMRSWWKQAFGFDVSVLEMLGMGSFEALGRHCADGLLIKFVASEGI